MNERFAQVHGCFCQVEVLGAVLGSECASLLHVCIYTPLKAIKPRQHTRSPIVISIFNVRVMPTALLL